MVNTVTIDKKITNGDELIVMKRDEYEKLTNEIFELQDAYKKIRDGEIELIKGKTTIVNSLDELN